jgi:hypothetical protein
VDSKEAAAFLPPATASAVAVTSGPLRGVVLSKDGRDAARRSSGDQSFAVPAAALNGAEALSPMALSTRFPPYANGANGTAAVKPKSVAPVAAASGASASVGTAGSAGGVDDPIDLKENVAVVVRIRPAAGPGEDPRSTYGWGVTPYAMTELSDASAAAAASGAGDRFGYGAAGSAAAMANGGGGGGAVAGAPFYFERVFGPTASTAKLYAVAAKPIVEQIMLGFNGTIFAYGQTGSGNNCSPPLLAIALCCSCLVPSAASVGSRRSLTTCRALCFLCFATPCLCRVVHR